MLRRVARTPDESIDPVLQACPRDAMAAVSEASS
jgi:hypothetical protein